MHNAKELQQALAESEAAASQSSTTSSLPLVVDVSAPTSQQPLQELPLVLAVKEVPHETPSVADAQVASVPTDK